MGECCWALAWWKPSYLDSVLQTSPFQMVFMSMLAMAGYDLSYLTLHPLLHILFLRAALSQGCTYSPGPSGSSCSPSLFMLLEKCLQNWRHFMPLFCVLLYSLCKEGVISWVIFFPHYFPPPPRILLAFPALICQFAAPTARKYHLVQNSPILKELGSYSGSRGEVCHLVLSWRPKASLPSPGKITEAPKRRESMTLAVSDRQRRQLHAPCLS